MLMVSGKDEESVSVGVCEIYRYALIEERLERNRLIIAGKVKDRIEEFELLVF